MSDLDRGFSYASDMVQCVVLPFPPLLFWPNRLSARGLLVLGIMEAVLGFFSRQDEYMSNVCLHQYGGSIVFRKAPSGYSTRRFLPRDWRLRWDLVVRTHVFYLTVWFKREHCESSPSFYHHVARFLGP
jgi:hypothetical protein